MGNFILSSSLLKKELVMRRIALFLMSMVVALLFASAAVLALPSEKPDRTRMVDGRVSAIEQVGTNVWLGGKFTQVKKRDGTVLGSVSNVAVFNSETNRFKNLAPKLGGTDSEVWDMTLYGNDVLIAGNFPGPSITQKNLVLVKGAGPNAGQVIRWYNSPSLKSVLAAPGLGRVYGGGVSLSAFDFATGKKLWTKAKTTVDPPYVPTTAVRPIATSSSTPTTPKRSGLRASATRWTATPPRH